MDTELTEGCLMSSKIQIPLDNIINLEVNENNLIFEVKGSKVTFKKKKCE